jgi:uncharacterized membrane protein (DUF373 family)
VIESDSFGKAVAVSEILVRLVETVTAYILVGLFAVGVFDLGLVILDLVLSGRITEASNVVDLIDTALLLLIIVEVYQTLVAYIQKDNEGTVVRTVIYAGVIAMVRKIIVFQTGDYDSVIDALAVASSYTLILVGLGALLFVNYSVSWEDEGTQGGGKDREWTGGSVGEGEGEGE